MYLVWVVPSRVLPPLARAGAAHAHGAAQAQAAQAAQPHAAHAAHADAAAGHRCNSGQRPANLPFVVG